MLDGKGMYQGLLISVLSSCLKTAQQVYSWAHLLLSLCFFSNLNIHPSVDTNPKVFHKDNEDCEKILAQSEVP